MLLEVNLWPFLPGLCLTALPLCLLPLCQHRGLLPVLLTARGEPLPDYPPGSLPARLSAALPSARVTSTEAVNLAFTKDAVLFPDPSLCFMQGSSSLVTKTLPDRCLVFPISGTPENPSVKQ